MNLVEHTCPRGHNMLAESGPGSVFCLECDRLGNTRAGSPDYEVNEIQPAVSDPDAEGVVPTTVGELSTRLNVYSRMLPIDRWQYDRFSIGLAIAEYLEELPKFRWTFKLRQLVPLIKECDTIKEGFADMHSAIDDRLWLSHGVQPMAETEKTTRIYCNPNYAHNPTERMPFEWSDPEDSLTYWTMMHATLGRHSPHVTENILSIDNVYDYDPDYDRRRELGRIKMANTYRAFIKWADCPIAEAGRALGVNDSTIHTYLNNYCQIDEAPPEPSQDPAFCGDIRQPSRWRAVGGGV